MLNLFFIISFYFLWAKTLGATTLLDLQFKGREESTKEWGMKLKILATRLKLCVMLRNLKVNILYKEVAAHSLGRCFAPVDLASSGFFLYLAAMFAGEIFHTNLPLVQRFRTPGQRAVRPQKVGFYVSELVFLHLLCRAGQILHRSL